MKMLYLKEETHVRIKALARIEGRTMIETIDRIMREAVAKVDQGEYNAAVEAVTTDYLAGAADEG